jgi:hypothetical protein
MTIHTIKHRFTSAILFECDVPDAIESGLRTRHALEKAVEARANLAGADLADANLAGADLAGANLARAYLAGANLARANLARANLADANLGDANLAGANETVKTATNEQAIENLDKVRAIIMDNRERLQMGHWHGDDAWKERTCAEETLCGTTHCMAGWLQVCSTDPAIRDMPPRRAGLFAAPIASKMFYRDGETAYKWLESRQYVQDISDHERRVAERKARKAAEAAGAQS